MFKYIGSEKQLKECGFIPYFDKDVDCITSFTRKSKLIDNEVMVAWERNCSLEKGGIGSRYNYEEISKDDIQDLIDKGLVEWVEL